MNRKSFLKSVAFLGAVSTAYLNAAEKKSAKNDDKKIKPENGGGFETDALIYKTGNAKITVSVPENYKSKIDNLDVMMLCGDGAVNDEDGSSGWLNMYKPSFSVVDGKIEINTRLNYESRYTVVIHDGKFSKKTRRQDRTPEIAYLRIYALKPDLFALRPLKGDTHIHSTNSDGANKPLDVALRNYEVGMDYQAISDHRVWQTSEDMRLLFSKYPTSMSFFHAEECHYTSVHVQNLGGEGSLTDYIKNNRKEYDAITEKYLATIPEKNISKKMRRIVAATEAEFEIIRKLKGLAVLNHPYWEANGAKAPFFNMTWQSIDLLCERKNFDIYEFVNICCGDISVSLANSKYVELASKGIKYPVIGTSDAHNVKSQGNGYTVAFAKASDFQSVKKAIMTNKSVAVAAYNGNEMIFGDIRLVNFMYFLYKVYFPKHDKLVAEEGKILRKIIEKGDDPNLIKKLNEISTQIENLYPSMKVKA